VSLAIPSPLAAVHACLFSNPVPYLPAIFVLLNNVTSPEFRGAGKHALHMLPSFPLPLIDPISSANGFSESIASISKSVGPALGKPANGEMVIGVRRKLN